MYAEATALIIRKLLLAMSINIDWNRLQNLPLAKEDAFEKFCFHIASRMFSDYGTVSYFYNTPGSEFYIQLNVPYKYGGVQYQAGDVIGWQAKFWIGNGPDNSPLGSDHIKELKKGFDTTKKYKSDIKLWIVCTPGAFVESQWDKLYAELKKTDSKCHFLSWHKDIFEDVYLKEPSKYNSIFKFYFGEHFLGKERLDEISKDTLSILSSKYDSDLHTPSRFEQLLLSIVDDKAAEKILEEKINSLYNHAQHDEGKALPWDNYPEFSDSFKDGLETDNTIRFDLIKELHGFIEKDSKAITNIQQINDLLVEYDKERKPRIQPLNEELQKVLSKENEGSYYTERMYRTIFNPGLALETLISRSEEGNLCLKDYASFLTKSYFPVFAEAGYGKTHFACSLAKHMLDRSLPVLFLMGSKFKNYNTCSSVFIDTLGLSPNHTIEDALDILDFIGEINNCRLPIIIDGLNESAPNEEKWRYDLPTLSRCIESRQHLILVTTCREKADYIKAIYDQDSYKDIPNHIKLEGIEDKDLYYTTKRYFKKYDIHPINKSALEMFRNPLLLKIFCVTNKGRKDFTLDENSLTSCLFQYNEQLISDIAYKSDGHHLMQAKVAIEDGLRSLAKLIWEKNDRTLDYSTEFFKALGQYSDDLLNEGMCFMVDRCGDEHSVQFTYDMMAGFQIANYIIHTCNTSDDLKLFIENHYETLFGTKPHTLAEDISKNLLYLIPKKYSQEWFEIQPDEKILLLTFEHLDVVLSSDDGVKAVKKIFVSGILNSPLKEELCNNLFKRIYEQRNLNHFSVFTRFFLEMNATELDLLWNSKFAGYQLLKSMLSILTDSYWSKPFKKEDKIAVSVMLTGITDREFREKFMYQSLTLMEEDTSLGLNICSEYIQIKDPFIFEAALSLITGLALRSNSSEVTERSISILECFLQSYDSNHIVLLDDLETLYSFSEDLFGIKHDRTKLNKNYEERWPHNCDEDIMPYNIYDYDFDKYNIRPLYEWNYKRGDSKFTSDQIYGMLWHRVKLMGFDENAYRNLQSKENENVKYRQSLVCSYVFEYGRHALMELYGWMLLHQYIPNEYVGTFRTAIIDIDPSFPRFSPKMSLTTKSFMPKSVNELSSWIKESDIDILKSYLITKLPRSSETWILMNGYLEQLIDDRYAHTDVYINSELIPLNRERTNLYSALVVPESHYHTFASELGWRNLTFTEEHDEVDVPCLLSRYEFSSWDQARRFHYTNFCCLNTGITRKMGLLWDVKTMSYSYNKEIVSKFIVNDSDFFFFLRKDIVEQILKMLGCKLHQRIIESKNYLSKAPKTLNLPSKQYEDYQYDKYYIAQ